MFARIQTKIKQYSDGFLSLIYPEFCVCCGIELNSQSEHFCFMCRQELHYTYFEKYDDSTLAEETFWGRIKIENVYSLLYYQKGNSTQNILHRIKYQDGQKLGEYMGQMIGERLLSDSRYANLDAIVPIPLHTKKEFLRGYNQSLLIAKGVHNVLNIPIIEALYRKTHDESQTRKSKEERWKNVQDRFALKEGTLTNYKHVLLVDDVLTTGSTLEFAGKAILQNTENKKISIATIAIAHD